MPNFIGSILGLVLGLLLGAMLAAGTLVPAVPPLGSFLAPAQALVAGWSPGQVVTLVALIVVIAYLIAYVVATAAVGAGLSPPPGGILPDFAGELAARGFMVGLTGALNFSLLSLLLPLCQAGSSLACTTLVAILVAVPIWFWPSLPWAVLIIHWLCAFPMFSRNPFFQVLVGWISWIAPLSYLATAVGFLLFVINLPFSLLSLGLAAFRIDFRTGTIETAGGLVAAVSRALGYPGAAARIGGFSLGKFNFLIPATAGPLTGLASQGTFVGASVSSHEIGHSLNTSAMGGVVLWINAVDENVPPFAAGALAYGELLAESHALRVGRNAVRIWG